MSELSRRAFLKRLGYLTAAGVASPLTLNMMGVAEAATQTATDYKALVCVFLDGGNDQANTLIPIDITNYNTYKKVRQDIALDRSAVLPLRPTTNLADGLKWGFHPKLTGLNSLFHLKKVAVLQNVGTLIEPTSLAQYKNKSVALPQKLFAHNSQKDLWDTTASQAFREGWGGKVGDLILNQNSQSMFTCISTADNALFLTGDRATAINVSSNGIIPIWSAREDGWLHNSQKASAALRKIITSPRNNIMENHINLVTRRSMEAEKLMSSALRESGELKTQFTTGNSLADQLKTVARLIKSRDALGVKRQVFFVKFGDFDTHSDLLSKHGELMAVLDDALSSFYQATEELGVTQNVTTFTASDFGRTFSSNGNGSDHGWGSHHLIMGGAVNGREFYGKAPEIGLDTPEDVGQGRLLPTTSIDEYSATLAKWFGVSDSDLGLIAPNLYKFDKPDLGFMSR